MENKIQTSNIPDVGKILINGCYLEIDDSIEFINIKLRAAAKNFITVGITLQEIEKVKLYKVKGFSNIHEFAKEQFQLSKNQTYNLLAVAKKFSFAGSINESYKDFSFSQLVEMVSLPEADVLQISSDFTVKEIREVKKEVKIEQTLTDLQKVRRKNKEEKKVAEEIFNYLEEKEKEENKQKILDVEFQEIKQNKILENNFYELENEHIGLNIEFDKIRIENEKLKSENEILNDKTKKLLDIPDFDKNILKDNIMEYLNSRLEVLRALAKAEKKTKSEDYFLYLGGFNEIKFLIDDLKNEFVKEGNYNE